MKPIPVQVVALYCEIVSSGIDERHCSFTWLNAKLPYL